MFVNASGDGARGVSPLLDSHARGQRINLSRSSLFFSNGCLPTVEDEVKVILDVLSEFLSGNYLGMPSNIGSSKNGAFNYLKERFYNKL